MSELAKKATRVIGHGGSWLLAASLALFFPLPLVWAQIEAGSVKGTVCDASDARIRDAAILLENSLSGREASVHSSGDGTFQLENIPYGSYALTISAAGFQSSRSNLNVRSNVPVAVQVKLVPAAAQVAITVESSDSPQEVPRSETVIDESTIQVAPSAVRRDRLQSLISTTPGWATENDGLMHIRGVDDGILYVVGGVPTPDRLDGLFASSPNTDTVTSLDVITGNIPAEFGDRSGAVVIVQPKSGLDTPLSGMVSLGDGNFDTRNIDAALAGGTRKWGFFLAGTGQQSNRFLDPVDPRNFHNNGEDGSVEARADWHASDRDLVRIAGALEGAAFDVPNNLEQQQSGQQQRQHTGHNQQSIAWERTWSASTLTDVAYFRNFFQAQLQGCANDTPVTADQDRSHTRQGFLASISQVRHGHNIKAGIELSRVAISERFGFAVTDLDAAEEADISPAAMAFTPANPFQFFQTATRGSEAAYIQDDFSPVRNLNISAGVRFDRSNLLVEDHQISPRIGASYYIPKTRTSLRASFNRLYMPPQLENLLLASSLQARQLSPFAASGGGADIRPEHLSAYEVGFTQELPGKLRLNAAYWWRHFRNIDDPNVLLGTTIIFPNSVAQATANGLEARLDVPMRRGFSGFLSYSNSRVVEIGPINGGLFLDDNFLDIGPGTRFTPDHDERNVGSFGVTYSAKKRGVWTTFAGRYESGVPIEAPDLDAPALAALPGVNLVNLDTGRVNPWMVLSWSGGADVVRREHYTVAAELDVQNLANQAFVFNWGNPFSGTHFGYPRLIAGRLKFSFHK